MLEFADDYLSTLLKKQWSLLVGTEENDYADAASLDVWKGSMPSRVAKEHAEDAYNIFVTDGNRLIFYDAWNPTLFTIEQYTVAVGLEDARPVTQFFHHDNAGGVPFGGDEADDVFASHNSATIGLYVLAPSKTMCSFIQIFMRLAVLSHVDALVDDLGIDLCGGPRVATMVCPPEFAPNGIPHVYGRRVDFDFEVVETVTRLGGGQVIDPKPVLVHEIDDPVSFLVDRETRVQTPLDGTVFGRVRAKKE